MNTNVIVEFLLKIVDPTHIKILIALIAAHVCIGAFGAMIKGNFDLHRFFDFYKDAGKYFTAYIGAGILAYVLSDWTPIQDAALAALVVLFLDRITKKLHEWGIPVPEEGIKPAVNKIMNTAGKPVGKVLGKR